MESPVIYLISGPMAAGKSTVAHRLAARFKRGVHVEGPLLGDYRTIIRSRPCHVVVLIPSLQAVLAREAGRERKVSGAWTIERFYEEFVSVTPPVGVWIDTTDLTPDETVDAIVAHDPHLSGLGRHR